MTRMFSALAGLVVLALGLPMLLAGCGGEIPTGIAGAGLMMTMMRFEWLTLPLGVFGLVGAYAFHFREQRRCDSAGCKLVGERGTKMLLGVATAVVAVALLLKLFPSWTAAILQSL